jgi:WD40 repeat protein
MSPEQALAKRVPVDHRTDIYSLGVTLYELLTLQPAYDGRDRQEVMQQIAFEEPWLPRRHNKAIPVELETIVRKAMGKNPVERYATAQELADDLRRFLDDKPIRAKKPTLLDWTRKWARRHRGIVTTGIAGLTVAVVILMASTLLILSAYRSEAEQKLNAEKKSQSAVRALYRSLVREAEAIRRARRDGYRSKVWQRLREALELEAPEKDVHRLSQEAIACMGDFVGHDPITWDSFPADVNTIALHPNGRLLAIGLDNGTVLLRELGTDKTSSQLPRHSRPVSALAFAPDGTRLVSGDRDGTVHVCEAKTNGEWALTRSIIAGPTLAGLIPSAAFPFFVPHFVFPALSSIAISPDGKQLAASLFFVPPDGKRLRVTLFFQLPGYSLSSTIALWDLADGTRTSCFDSGRALEWVLSPIFSPDGKRLATSYLRYIRDGESLQSQQGVWLWDRDRRRDPHDLSPDLGFVFKAQFSPDSKLLACACSEGVALFDTTTLQCQRFPRAERASAVAFSPDSKVLAIANQLLGQVRLWNVSSDREVAVLGHPGGEGADALHSVACSREILVAASRRAVRTWSLAGSGEKLVLTGHDRGTNCLTFSPNGKLLASAGKDKMVKIWDSITGQLLKELPRMGAEAETAAFSADGKLLATGDWAESIQIWDIASGTKLASPPNHGIGRKIWSVAFSSDGRYFAACGAGSYSGGQRGVALWRIQPDSINHEAGTGLKLQAILGPAVPAAFCITFSPDSQLLAWVDKDDTVHLWDLEASRERPFPRVRLAGSWRCLAFLPEGKQLIFVTETGVAEAWDVTTGHKVFTFAGQESQDGNEMDRLECAIALSSDGSRLAGICGRNVTIWETASRTLSLRLPEEPGVIYSLAWSPNAERLAVGTGDGGLAIWDLAKLKEQLDELGLGW